MPERVDDRRVARTVSLSGLLTYGGAAVTGPLHRASVSATRSIGMTETDLWSRGFHTDLGIFVGEVEHAAADRELGMPDATVVHHDRFADDDGAKRVDVPVDRLSCIGHG